MSGIRGTRWSRPGSGGGTGAEGLLRTVDFHEWLTAALSGDVRWRKRVHAYDPKRLMHPFVFIDGRPAVDVLVRQECIDQGLRELGRKLRVQLPPLEIRENRSRRRRDHRTYYSDALAEAVGGYFSEIVSFCGYRFDPEDPDDPLVVVRAGA